MNRRALLSTLAVVLLCGAPHPAAEAQDDARALEQVLADPPATGVLVLMVVPGSQAEKAGLRAGDIITAYGMAPTPTVRHLQAAKSRAQGLLAVPLQVVRREKATMITIEPGEIGIRTMDVTKGQKVVPRPPATAAKLDLSRLKKGPVEAWYWFSLDSGTSKAGFEHHILRIEGDKLIRDSEVAFDGGRQWGLNHFLVRCVATAEPRPKLIATDFSAPLGHYQVRGRLEEKGGKRVWKTTVIKDEGEKTIEFAAPLDLHSDYMHTAVASMMPRKAGECLHVTTLNAGQGSIVGLGGLVCRGKEQTHLRGDKKVEAWRVEVVTMGRTGQVAWVDDEGRVVKNSYGSTTYSYLCSKDEALAGLHSDLKPQLKSLAR